MKNELVMQSRLHPARSRSSNEEKTGMDEELATRRREPYHNSEMKAKKRAANKAYWEQFKERSRDRKLRFVVDLDDNGTQLLFISLYDLLS